MNFKNYYNLEFKIKMNLYTSSGSQNCLIEKTLDKVNFDREHLARKDISREQAAFKECAKVNTSYLLVGCVYLCRTYLVLN